MTDLPTAQPTNTTKPTSSLDDLLTTLEKELQSVKTDSTMPENSLPEVKKEDSVKPLPSLEKTDLPKDAVTSVTPIAPTLKPTFSSTETPTVPGPAALGMTEEKSDKTQEKDMSTDLRTKAGLPPLPPKPPASLSSTMGIAENPAAFQKATAPSATKPADTNEKPPKPRSNKLLWIFGAVVLIAIGLVVGLLLVKRQQDIRQQAKIADEEVDKIPYVNPQNGKYEYTCPSDEYYTCKESSSGRCTCRAKSGNPYWETREERDKWVKEVKEKRDRAANAACQEQAQKYCDMIGAFGTCCNMSVCDLQNQFGVSILTEGNGGFSVKDPSKVGMIGTFQCNDDSNFGSGCSENGTMNYNVEGGRSANVGSTTTFSGKKCGVEQMDIQRQVNGQVMGGGAKENRCSLNIKHPTNCTPRNDQPTRENEPAPSPKIVSQLVCNSACGAGAACPTGQLCDATSGRCRNPSCPTDTDCVCNQTALVCNSSCTVGGQACPSGQVCDSTSGKCRNPSCLTSTTCACAAPSPVPSPVPSPRPLVCNDQCTSNAQCQSSQICDTSSGRCRNPSCLTATNCLCPGQSPMPSPVPSPVPTPTPPSDAGFQIVKFDDTNGNGAFDSSEKGLSWNFEWDLNGDNNWRKYETYSSNNGEGGRVGSLSDGDRIRVREITQSGWTATTPTTREITVRRGETVVVRFGNRIVSVTAQQPAASPQEQLPTAGSTSQSIGLLVVGAIVSVIGIIGFLGM